MATAAIHDRGRGPELVGTRTTVYDLLPYFLDPTATEDYIRRASCLTPEQVAVARAYIFRNLDTVIDEHLKIEARIALGNPPEVNEQIERTHQRLLKFREWMHERDTAKLRVDAVGSATEGGVGPGPFPTFPEWLAERDSRRVDES